MSRKIPVYLYGEVEPFITIPFEVFTTMHHGDTLSIPGENGIGIKAFTVVYKEAYIDEGEEPIYALQVEEW